MMMMMMMMMMISQTVPALVLKSLLMVLLYV